MSLKIIKAFKYTIVSEFWGYLFCFICSLLQKSRHQFVFCFEMNIFVLDLLVIFAKHVLGPIKVVSNR